MRGHEGAHTSALTFQSSSQLQGLFISSSLPFCGRQYQVYAMWIYVSVRDYTDVVIDAIDDAPVITEGPASHLAQRPAVRPGPRHHRQFTSTVAIPDGPSSTASAPMTLRHN